MKISQKLEYACKALAHLAKVHDTRQVTRLEEIARKELVPGNFLVQICNDLRRAGLIDSRRGKAGGYCLSRPPEEISLKEVVEAVDPHLLERTVSTDGDSGPSVRSAWDGVSVALRNSLEKIPLSQMSNSHFSPMFHI